MAKFLTTKGTAYHIEQLMIRAQSKLVLVTPYLQLSNSFQDRLLDANDRGIQITLVYGKSELHTKEKDLLYNLDNIHIHYLENLHAKCYYNDSELIIASMNLYAFSESNNREMGIFIDSEKDNELYNDAIREVQSILKASQLEFKPSETKKKQVELDPEFKAKTNFHLPHMYEIVKDRYEDYDIEFSKESDRISIADFPERGFQLYISHRLDFHYNDDKKKRFEENRGRLSAQLTDKRIYSNYQQINIYFSKSYDPELSPSGILDKVDRQLNVIEKIEQVFQ